MKRLLSVQIASSCLVMSNDLESTISLIGNENSILNEVLENESIIQSINEENIDTVLKPIVEDDEECDAINLHKIRKVQ